MAEKIVTISEEIEKINILDYYHHKKNPTEKRNNSKVFTSLVEWRDYSFFYCDEEEKESVKNILIEHEMLNSDGKPNTQKVKDNANYFGDSLATRLSTSFVANRIGLSHMANILLNLLAEKDYKAMYYFAVYMYGITRWRTPYNMQRTPISTALLKAYMTYFCEAFCLKAKEIVDETEGENEEIEETE